MGNSTRLAQTPALGSLRSRRAPEVQRCPSWRRLLQFGVCDLEGTPEFSAADPSAGWTHPPNNRTSNSTTAESSFGIADSKRRSLRQPGNRRVRPSVAKCHTFCVFWEPGRNLALYLSENNGEKKVPHSSHLSPLSHLRGLSWGLVVV